MFIRNFITVFFLVCNFILISCKKMPESKIKPKKLNECERCELLSNSFIYWLDKTSRGKFEGGDVDWEEKSLRPYATSEVRLVDIQEGLCSELSRHKDDCYAFKEDVEEIIENWWFERISKAGSLGELQTWLCIDKLRHCCPKSHYGADCEPCPQDDNNLICSGNGKCDGDGFRRGTGKCICRKGYVGKLCEECNSNYFDNNGMCTACDEACDGCTGKGRHSCLNCNTGWIRAENDQCVDLNECLDSTVCKNNQFCVNMEGSFSCKQCDDSCETCTGSGRSNCTSCPSNVDLWNGICVDENLKEYLVKHATQKALLYIGFAVILFFVSKRSKFFASAVVLIIATYIYALESRMVMSSFKVISNLLRNYLGL